MSTDPLFYLSATQAIDHFNSGELSPVELLESVIDRAIEVSDNVNPLADTYFDEARENARLAEIRYKKGNARKLEGIPLLVKDDSAIEGKRSTAGSLLNADNLDQHTHPVVNKLIRSGANVFARSTCPEFCWLFTCHSRLWGVTRNPWRLDITPGGSSGGSAAALAVGATTIATGSDSTGSIRQPASQCGVVGYKSPYGRNALDEMSSFDTYSAIGPMTRTVIDAALMQNIMSGPVLQDHNTLPNKIQIPFNLGHVKGMKIAYSADLGHYEMDSDVSRESLSTADALRNAGAIVEEIDIDWASEAIELAGKAQEFLFAGTLKEAMNNHPDLLSEYVPQLYETASAVTADEYRQSLSVAGEIWFNHLGPLFENYDALITPSVACPEVPAENRQKDIIKINGKPLTDTDTSMSVLFNMFNRCPVLSVPAGMTDRGLPVGIQIVGRPYNDTTVFHIGQAVERQRPWSSRRPEIPVTTNL